jgi:hypothetical protein
MRVGYKDILRLYISVGNAFRVKELYGQGDLPRDNTALVIVKLPTMRKHVREQVSGWCEFCKYISMKFSFTV